MLHVSLPSSCRGGASFERNVDSTGTRLWFRFASRASAYPQLGRLIASNDGWDARVHMQSKARALQKPLLVELLSKQSVVGNA